MCPKIPISETSGKSKTSRCVPSLFAHSGIMRGTHTYRQTCDSACAANITLSITPLYLPNFTRPNVGKQSSKNWGILEIHSNIENCTRTAKGNNMDWADRPNGSIGTYTGGQAKMGTAKSFPHPSLSEFKKHPNMSANCSLTRYRPVPTTE